MSEPEEPWMRDARCADEAYPVSMFFPEQGGDVTRAKEVCRECLVREECLEFALENKFPNGVWGGTSERERRKILRERRKIAVAVAYRPLQKGA